MTADFLPPHRTGRADFLHPALAGHYCATHSQGDESHPFELRVNGCAFRGPPRPLAAAAKMPRQAFPHEAVGLPEGVPAVPRPAAVGMMNTFQFIGLVGGAGAPKRTEKNRFQDKRWRSGAGPGPRGRCSASGKWFAGDQRPFANKRASHFQYFIKWQLHLAPGHPWPGFAAKSGSDNRASGGGA